MIYETWKESLLGLFIFSLSSCSIFVTLWYPALVVLVPLIMSFGLLGSIIIPSLIWNDKNEMYKEIRKKVKDW